MMMIRSSNTSNSNIPRHSSNSNSNSNCNNNSNSNSNSNSKRNDNAAEATMQESKEWVVYGGGGGGSDGSSNCRHRLLRGGGSSGGGDGSTSGSTSGSSNSSTRRTAFIRLLFILLVAYQLVWNTWYYYYHASENTSNRNNVVSLEMLTPMTTIETTATTTTAAMSITSTRNEEEKERLVLIPSTTTTTKKLQSFSSSSLPRRRQKRRRRNPDDENYEYDDDDDHACWEHYNSFFDHLSDDTSSNNNNNNNNNHKRDNNMQDGCRVNGDGTRVHCQWGFMMQQRASASASASAYTLRWVPSRMHGARRGGEPLATVMGQAEVAEHLSYDPGAFQVVVNDSSSTPSAAASLQLPAPQLNFAYMNKVLQSFQFVTTPDQTATPCAEYWNGTTLFITRNEYVNVYHTMTEWWNTFFSMPFATIGTADGAVATDDDNDDSAPLEWPVRIVFLDAHPAGNLDDVWKVLWGGPISFARHVLADDSDNANAAICVERARFVPPGYNTPVWPGRSPCPTYREGADFVQFVLQRFALTHVRRIPGRSTYYIIPLVVVVRSSVRPSVRPSYP